MQKTKSFDEFCQIAEPTAARIRQIHGPTDERTLIARAVLAIIYLDERNDDLLRLLEEVAENSGHASPERALVSVPPVPDSPRF